MGLPLQTRERDGIVSGAELRAPPQKRAMGVDGDVGGAQPFLGSVLFHPMLPSHTLRLGDWISSLGGTGITKESMVSIPPD